MIYQSCLFNFEGLTGLLLRVNTLVVVLVLVALRNRVSLNIERVALTLTLAHDLFPLSVVSVAPKCVSSCPKLLLSLKTNLNFVTDFGDNV